MTISKDSMITQEDIIRSNSNILSEHYDIGQLVHQEKIERGYINDSYKIEMLRDGKQSRYLLRRYRHGTPEQKVRFEHALLHELQAREFVFSPRVIPTKEGTSYVKIEHRLKKQARRIYMAVFSFMPGEDKCSWDHPLYSDEELINSAQILALYHNKIFGWQGTEDWRVRSTNDEINLMAPKWEGYARNATDSPFDKFFLEQFNDLLGMLENIPFQEKYNALPRLAIHGDYHPGNLKFQDGKVTAVLDFGWSKIDARCIDVGLAILYFCTSWHVATDGNLQLDRASNFLGAYQQTAKDINTVGPLNQLELEYLPQMIHMGNLIVIDWILRQFYSAAPDPQQYLRYLRHSIALNRWLKNNLNDLASCIQQHNTK
jgi:homoserine kinase type II